MEDEDMLLASYRVTCVSRSQSRLCSLQESLQETAVGASREEDRPQLADYTFCRVSLRAPDVAPVLEAAEESSVLSSEEAWNAKDQDFRLIRRLSFVKPEWRFERLAPCCP